MKLIMKWLTTNDPTKKFAIECQLMALFSGRSRFLRKYFQRRIFYRYGCDISHTARIDESVVFGHPLCVVIGSNAVIERSCRIYQGVTVGANLAGDNSMPLIKQNTTVCAGAKLIGGIVIGENCIIGANAVVTKNVPDDSVVVSANKIISNKSAPAGLNSR